MGLARYPVLELTLTQSSQSTEAAGEMQKKRNNQLEIW